MNPDAAIEMWVGTFHAFGLELITKWPSAIDRTGDVTVLDEAGSLALLENNLAKRLSATGQIEEAVEHFRRALELSKSSADAPQVSDSLAKARGGAGTRVRIPLGPPSYFR